MPEAALTTEEPTPFDMSSLHEQTPPPEPAKEPEAKVEEPKVEEPAAPGTPDKALQKVQQDLATALRKVDELTASITERQAKDLPPTVKQQQDLQAARAKIEKIRAARSADDPLEETLNEARDGILDVDERLKDRFQKSQFLSVCFEVDLDNENSFEKTAKRVVISGIILFLGYVAIVLTIIGGLGYVAYHFLSKVW